MSSDRTTPPTAPTPAQDALTLRHAPLALRISATLALIDSQQRAVDERHARPARNVFVSACEWDDGFGQGFGHDAE